MTPERYQQICRLYHDAVSLAPARRMAFIEEACRGDDALRQAVEEMLAADEQAEAQGFIAEHAHEIAVEMLMKEQRSRLIGRSLNQYRILSLLGAGGMGEVWLAEDTRLGRKVALKLLPEHFAADPERLRRFEREAKAASATTHPNIVTIHEIGESGGTYYLVQEYVKGETLRTRIARGPLPLLDALDIAYQIANALATAHAMGIVHRDVKPDNIMLRRDGIVKVLDFGLAKLVETGNLERGTWNEDANTRILGSPEKEKSSLRDHHSTLPGLVIGTTAYMSPEQTRGRKLDSRSDLWSLGVVLYEMLTGQRPFRGESTPDIFVAILERQPTPLSEFRADLPGHVEQLMDKLLEKDREQRYQSSAELAAELKRYHHRLELDAERESGAGSEAPTRLIKQTVPTAEPRATGLTDGEQVNSPAITSPASSPSSSRVFRLAKNRRIRAATFALILLALISSAVYLIYSISGRNRPIDSIAVLPFENRSGNPELAYISDGLSESLIDQLSELPQLKVIARNSSFKFRGANLDLRQAASQLGVRAIVTGSVAQIGDDLVIRFALVDASEDRQIAGGQYQRKPGDIIGVQNEIAQAASQKLRLLLSDSQSRRLAENGTENSDAYRYYLNGLVELNGPQDVRGKALEYFEQAVTLDPEYAAAHAEIAWVYVMRATGSGNPHELMPKAKAAIERALTLDPNLAKSHALRAVVYGYEFDWLNAEREYLRAIELSPNLDFTRNNYAFFLSVIGRHNDALAELEQQRIRDPINQRMALLQKGIILTQARRFDDALQTYKEAQAVDPDKKIPFSSLGYAYAGKGLYSAAAAYYRESVDLLGGEQKYSQSLVYLAATYAKIPEKQGEARAILSRIETMRDYVSPALLSAVHAALGENDKAMGLLEQAYLARDPLLRYVGCGYEYDGLRADPRFKAMLKRLNLPES